MARRAGGGGGGEGEEGLVLDGRKERHERGADESDQRRPAEYVQWHARASESPSENAKPSCKACAMVAVALCSASDSVTAGKGIKFLRDH